ncbi:hypothetical protein, partial [uncultured Bilophila sp.]|uniref:hypothetical protein n=1 Tax=uncultured Bilophila sp. TaxID=529385 RepID=UPI00260A95E4
GGVLLQGRLNAEKKIRENGPACVPERLKGVKARKMAMGTPSFSCHFYINMYSIKSLVYIYIKRLCHRI